MGGSRESRLNFQQMVCNNTPRVLYHTIGLLVTVAA